MAKKPSQAPLPLANPNVSESRTQWSMRGRRTRAKHMAWAS